MQRDCKRCGTCKHFRRFYAETNADLFLRGIITTSTGKSLVAIYCGECTNRERTKESGRRSRRYYAEACYLYEEKEDEKDD